MTEEGNNSLQSIDRFMPMCTPLFPLTAVGACGTLVLATEE
jgi:hypothetical protein